MFSKRTMESWLIYTYQNGNSVACKVGPTGIVPQISSVKLSDRDVPSTEISMNLRNSEGSFVISRLWHPLFFWDFKKFTWNKIFQEILFFPLLIRISLWILLISNGRKRNCSYFYSLFPIYYYKNITVKFDFKRIGSTQKLRKQLFAWKFPAKELSPQYLFSSIIFYIATGGKMQDYVFWIKRKTKGKRILSGVERQAFWKFDSISSKHYSHW